MCTGDFHHSCHGMLVFPRFCHSHHRSVKVPRAEKSAPQTPANKEHVGPFFLALAPVPGGRSFCITTLGTPSHGKSFLPQHEETQQNWRDKEEALQEHGHEQEEHNRCPFALNATKIRSISVVTSQRSATRKSVRRRRKGKPVNQKKKAYIAKDAWRKNLEHGRRRNEHDVAETRVHTVTHQRAAMERARLFSEN